MNGIQIKPDHASALEKDAAKMGLEPNDVLDVILRDFFTGWRPEDRPKFYQQVIHRCQACGQLIK